MKLGHWQKFQKLQYKGVEIELIFVLFSEIWMVRFSELPYLGMKVGPCQKFQKLHIYSLSAPMGSKSSLFSLYKYSAFRDAGRFSKFIWVWNLAIGKSSRSCTYTLTFTLVGLRFPRYKPIVKITIFGHGTQLLANVPEVANCMFKLFLPQGMKIELIFTLQAVVSEILADFQNCHI